MVMLMKKAAFNKKVKAWKIHTAIMLLICYSLVKVLFTNKKRQYRLLKSSLLFKNISDFTGEYLRS